MDGVNATMTRFGYPDTCLAEYDHWVVLLRPQQVTLGALILACRKEATRFSDISGDAFTELRSACVDIESGLESAVAYEKINYLMLMMVDPHVHFHVLPRYEGERSHNGVSFPDRGWPAAPDLSDSPDLPADEFGRLVEHFRAFWPS